MKWKTLSSQYLTNFDYFTARKDKCITPSGKVIEEYYVVEMRMSVCALAITNDGRVIMVDQFRYPVNKNILEIPGGFIDKNEDPEKAMARELLEETGYQFEKIEEVGMVAANPGVLSNYTKLYLATGGQKIAEQTLDPNEEIEIKLIPLEELIQMFLENKIEQALHTSCIFFALKKLGLLKKA